MADIQTSKLRETFVDIYDLSVTNLVVGDGQEL